MKCLRTLIVFDSGNVAKTGDWRDLHSSYVRSIKSIEHPAGSGKLLLQARVGNAKSGFRRNGVGYLRKKFLEHVKDIEGWEAEGKVDMSRDREPPLLRLYPSLGEHREEIVSDFGGFDLVATGKRGLRIAIEWETGVAAR